MIVYGIVLCCLVFLPEITLGFEYKGFQVYNVKPVTQTHLNLLNKLNEKNEEDYDVWQLPPVPGQNATIMVSPRVQEKFRRHLDNAGMAYQLLESDVERLIKVQTKKNTRARYRREIQSNRPPPHTYYMRYHEIAQKLDDMARVSSIAQIQNIGTSVEGRRIIMMKISKNSALPIIWIDAGIHAREWVAPAAALYLIDKLLQSSTEANTLLEKYQYYIVPLVNPDGYEYTHTTARLWRKNRSVLYGTECHGVDLNRNFPYRWGGQGASPNACATTYLGAYPNSELETQAITRTLTSIRSNLKLYLTLHSYGQFIMSPFGFLRNRYPRNYAKLMQMGNYVSNILQQKYGRKYFVGSSADLLYAASGSSDDYVTGELDVPHSYTIELPDRGRYGFLLPPAYITSVGNQMWDALQEYKRRL